MDFSLKQALGVVIVVAIAAIVLITAVNLTRTNRDRSESSTNDMWNKSSELLNEATTNTTLGN